MIENYKDKVIGEWDDTEKMINYFTEELGISKEQLVGIGSDKANRLRLQYQRIMRDKE